MIAQPEIRNFDLHEDVGAVASENKLSGFFSLSQTLYIDSSYNFSLTKNIIASLDAVSISKLLTSNSSKPKAYWEIEQIV